MTDPVTITSVIVSGAALTLLGTAAFILLPWRGATRSALDVFLEHSRLSNDAQRAHELSIERLRRGLDYDRTHQAPP